MCIKLLLVNVFLTTYLLILLYPYSTAFLAGDLFWGTFLLLLSCQQQKAVLYVLSLRVFAKVQKRQSLLDLSCFCYNAKTSVIIRSFSGELLIEPEARSFSTLPPSPGTVSPLYLSFLTKSNGLSCPMIFCLNGLKIVADFTFLLNMSATICFVGQYLNTISFLSTQSRRK